MSGGSDAFFNRRRNLGVRRVVGRSVEFQRVESLPRRTGYPDVTDLFTDWLRASTGPTPTGVPEKLRATQAWALWEAANIGGIVGNLGVGVGKTLLTYVMPVVLDAQRPILLVPGNLRKKTEVDFKSYAGHWRGHPNLRVITYQQLSRVSSEKLLEQIVPDLIIADEVHFLKNTTAGCTRRVKRWMEAHPDTRFVGLSGTITRRSIMDYAHLSKWSLKDGSPLPQSLNDLLDWADSLDEGIPPELRPQPGALLDLCQPGETPREGYRRRLLETPGVVSSESPLVLRPDGTNVGLNIIERQLFNVPTVVGDMVLKLRESWETPDGEILMTALEASARARELALGFYYKWNWPAVDPTVYAQQGHSVACLAGCKKDHLWLDARKAWRKFVRLTIKHSQTGSRPFDTEQQVALAVRAGEVIPPNNEYYNWTSVRERWDTDKLKQAVWIDEFILKDIERWVRACQKVGQKGIVWVESLALLEKLHKAMPDVPFYPSGNNGIMNATDTCIASMSHKTGKNLQQFDTNLVVEISTSGNDWEQLLGRTHRSGQQADEVSAELYLHTAEMWEAFDQARRDSAYVEQTWKQVQRLSYATIAVTPPDEIVQRVLLKDPLFFKPE